jgi:hypothetical protein
MELQINKNNPILKILNSVFKEYSVNKDEIDRFSIYKIFFINKIIDIGEFDIFTIHGLLNQLTSSEEEIKENNNQSDQSLIKTDFITFHQFLNVVFYIYNQQKKKYMNSDSPEDEQLNDVKGFPSSSIQLLLEDRMGINSCTNIIKVLLDSKEKDKDFMDLCSPLFPGDSIEDDSSSEGYIDLILSKHIIEHVRQYAKDFKNKIYNSYAITLEEKNLSYINFYELHLSFFEHPVYQNMDCRAITSVMRYFFYPKEIENKIEEFENIFDEKLDYDELKAKFNNIDLELNEINFSFSTVILIYTMLAIKYLEIHSGGKNQIDAIDAIDDFFKEKLNLKSEFEVQEFVLEESIHEEEPEYYPESIMYEEALKMRDNPIEDDEMFLQECLGMLDKDLPEIPNEIKSMINSTPNQSNTLYNNPVKIEKVKFPLATGFSEIDEQNTKKLDEKERMMIERAKKAKKGNARDPPPKAVFFEDPPNKEYDQMKYFGNPRHEDLKKRFLKNSFKETLYNTHIHPSIIKEVLLIPKVIPKDVTQIILLSFKDSNSGNYEMAIRKFEKAQKEFLSSKILSTQVDLYFYLISGSFYESAELNLMALKFYQKAKFTSDKSYIYDPDVALVYCFLGSLMIRLREYEWAFRCFLKAKDIRENSIGGDSPDTASVYNNLGVCSYYMDAFYPAKAYFQLAYEIYKQTLGTFHQRTLLIKQNLTKMTNLKFTKAFEFKSLPLFPTVKLLKDNDKKAKKK